MHGHGPRPRREAPRFVRGRGRFVDDIALPGMLHLAVLRSPVAHGRILSIDTLAARAHPKVRAVVTGADLAERGLAWMPTLLEDHQAVLATDKVRFQGQEVAFVVAEDRYAARDALELIDVEYEHLPVVVDARAALAEDAPLVRDDLPGKGDNLAFEWEAGDADATRVAFARADVTVAQEMVFPRVHPAPLETCGAVADYDRVEGRLTVWVTSQAPHAHRMLFSVISGLPEHRIRVVSPDVGGGFGNKVPLYPGYLCAIVGSMLTGRPVKWVEDRTENLVSTTFARDYVMRGEIAADSDGRILAVRTSVLADHGAFNAAATPTRYPAGFFGVFTGSYDLEAAHCSVTAVHTNKAPGGVAYACSFRIAEAVYLVERMVDVLARELAMDPAELRRRNLVPPGKFPYKTPTGWVYDSGDYPTALARVLELAGYDDLRAEQAARRAEGRLMGIGLSFFTEAVGAGPRKDMDMAGLGMADTCEVRVHPTGKVVVRLAVQTQGQGHETTFAQIVAEELGIPTDDVDVVHGDTDVTPFGLGTYGSRSTPVSGAAAALAARRVRDRARLLAATILDAAPADLEWVRGGFRTAGAPDRTVTLAEVAALAYGRGAPPVGDREAALEASVCYDPAELTYPYGAYLCVVDVDPGTGKVTVRRFVTVDDCGTRINDEIVEGQIHRGLTDGIGIALMEYVGFDEHGNCLNASLMDYLIPTALEVPDWETAAMVTPSPHHPLGAKGVGESATVGSPAAVVNAVVDALAPYGVRHADMPLTPSRVWEAMQSAPDRAERVASAETDEPGADR
ncbi:aerobic carbon-monoxide dehydrogenase large subunit [Nocardioides sp. YIM 152588]|uniref:aerobic carbon-monoxide dehydrogenase large subunit n=1 Tax=Nocardioides sp. YIM 152588 TaxID=3158259 RepID=UPI0032E48164